jgi:hypothetical protein
MSENSLAARPEPPNPAPDGFEWRPEKSGAEWRLADEDAKCRFSGRPSGACGDPATVARLRGIGRKVPWNYCAPHAAVKYNRWAEDGAVWSWVLHPVAKADRP